MRFRASVAVVSGALALSALSVPAAQAADGGLDLPKSLSSFAGTNSGNGKITGVTVNGGKGVAVGVSKKRITISVTAQRKGGAVGAVALPYRGSFANPSALLVPNEPSSNPCSYGSTTLTCKYTFDLDPKTTVVNEHLTNQDAGAWKIAAFSFKENGDTVSVVENYRSVKFQRAAKLTANAAPEPVRRGANITVTGDLTRANWDTLKYGGFTSGAVKLQYKKQGTTTWKTLKTVSADSRGKVKTTTKASADGHYRLSYGGSTTTGGATSAADFIDVR
ncbi:calcium-binding protein [Streptomyces sp. NPDC049906]|uniref:calcium-binding protein n=1 Tax=Streptomyces sp. NPDC049906 TaxID=3155656 RepID=UPI00341E063D